LAQLFLGLVLTVLMQSSSASLTVALSAAQAWLISAQGAAAVVIGANIGTTVTTVLAALLLLPWLVRWLLQAKAALGLPPLPALTMAMFHTTFNVMGVALMGHWPRP